MRNLVCACFVVALLTSAAITQNPAKTAPPQPIETKVFLIAGEVSQDETTLISNDINKWVVTNAALLKGYAGKYVTVRCQVDPDKHVMHVLSIMRQELLKYNPNDSAFRR
jgi:hypothetical protein